MAVHQEHKAKKARQVAQSLPQRQSPIQEPTTQVELSAPQTLQRAVTQPRRLTPGGVQMLQRAYGNRAVGQLIQRQPPEEDEELLQGRFSDSVQRQIVEEEEEPLQGKSPADTSPIQLQEETTQLDNKTGMPDQLKAGIESLSGMDMSDVCVHYNSSKPAQLNALAYVQGKDIHLASGQEKHLPHEAWHVVQQRQGRVKPTMQVAGEQINDDVTLEREADEVGRKAAAQRKPNSIPSGTMASSKGEGKAKPRKVIQPVIQRRIGLEIEGPSSWLAVKIPYIGRPSVLKGQHETLIEGHLFNLETELSGKLEFVTKPILFTAVLENTVSDMKDIAQELQDVNPDQINPRRVKGYRTRQKVIPRDDLPAGMKSRRSVIRPSGENFTGGFQATMGVPLEELKKTLPRKDRNIDRTEYEDRAADAIAQVESIDNISAKMKGLITLILYYITVGKLPHGKSVRAFPKGLTQAMARTNFAHMFSMTRESKQEEDKRFPSAQDWSDAICEAAGEDSGRNLFEGKWHQDEQFGPEDERVDIELTIDQWLKGIYNGTDLLTKEAFAEYARTRESLSDQERLSKQVDRIKTMGSLGGKTDFVIGGEGAIIELRWLDFVYQPLDKWGEFTQKIIEIYDKVRMGATED